LANDVARKMMYEKCRYKSTMKSDQIDDFSTKFSGAYLYA